MSRERDLGVGLAPWLCWAVGVVACGPAGPARHWFCHVAMRLFSLLVRLFLVFLAGSWCSWCLWWFLAVQLQQLVGRNCCPVAWSYASPPIRLASRSWFPKFHAEGALDRRCRVVVIAPGGRTHLLGGPEGDAHLAPAEVAQPGQKSGASVPQATKLHGGRGQVQPGSAPPCSAPGEAAARPGRTPRRPCPTSGTRGAGGSPPRLGGCTTLPGHPAWDVAALTTCLPGCAKRRFAPPS